VSLDENAVVFVVRPGKPGKEAFVTVEPPGFVEVTGTVKTTKKRDPEKVVLHLEPKGPLLRARFSGTIPDAGRPLRVAKRVDDPRLLAGHALRSILKDAGIETTGDIRLGGDKERHRLVAHGSARLSELLFAVGKESDNFYAEMIFKSLGSAKRTRRASSDAAAEVVTRELQSAGAVEAGVVVKNGSGLFDANKTTPRATAELLRYAFRSTSSSEFVAQLAVGGVDGTLRGRFRSWAKRRNIRAKTGTLDAVATLSGYVLAPPGRAPVAFAIYVNGVSGKVSGARTSIDRVVDAIARDVWKGTDTPNPP
jgi:serine-type D-Ala-D-Ala carboxypeptidase/endopeptidase (penicillin-binding protein 4)